MTSDNMDTTSDEIDILDDESLQFATRHTKSNWNCTDEGGDVFTKLTPFKEKSLKEMAHEYAKMHEQIQAHSCNSTSQNDTPSTFTEEDYRFEDDDEESKILNDANDLVRFAYNTSEFKQKEQEKLVQLMAKYSEKGSVGRLLDDDPVKREKQLDAMSDADLLATLE
jgi:hypothetical protein